MRRHLARLLYRLGRRVDPEVGADASRTVYTNMVGNAVQDLGRYHVAQGRFTEYVAEGNIALDRLSAWVDKLCGPVDTDDDA